LCPIVVAVLVGVIIGRVRADEAAISGRLVDGYRVLRVETDAGDLAFTVYRGDYLKFVADAEQRLVIPQLDVDVAVGRSTAAATVVKAKQVGRFDLSMGDRRGVLQVVGYRRGAYTELSSKDAKKVLTDQRPLLLDVRTRREFAQARIAGARLIPVQELQRRLAELSPYKEKPILIYCATGNRSTVASKILNDQGFTHIYNLRRGIVGWHRDGLPVER